MKGALCPSIETFSTLTYPDFNFVNAKLSFAWVHFVGHDLRHVTGAGLAASGNSVSSQGLINPAKQWPTRSYYFILMIFELGFMIFMYLRKILICD